MTIIIRAHIIYIRLHGHLKLILPHIFTRSLLLFNEGRLLKLCDFGTARKLDVSLRGMLTNGVGTARYMAPEVIRGTYMCARAYVCIYVCVCTPYYIINPLPLLIFFFSIQGTNIARVVMCSALELQCGKCWPGEDLSLERSILIWLFSMQLPQVHSGTEAFIMSDRLLGYGASEWAPHYYYYSDENGDSQYLSTFLMPTGDQTLR